jgi:hypothetical protein
MNSQLTSLSGDVARWRRLVLVYRPLGRIWPVLVAVLLILSCVLPGSATASAEALSNPVSASILSEMVSPHGSLPDRALNPAEAALAASMENKSLIIDAEACLLDSPLAPVDWRVVMCDTFSANDNLWPTADIVDEVSRIRFDIGDGAYRWTARALQGFSQSAYPNMQPVSDFYVSVEAQKLTGPDDVDMRIRFRRVNAANSYTFGIDETKNFWVNMIYRGDWYVLIDATPSDLIQPGAPNRLAVKAEGPHFTFYINDQPVAQLTDYRLQSGTIGIAAGLTTRGDRAQFQFRNFQLRAP